MSGIGGLFLVDVDSASHAAETALCVTSSVSGFDHPGLVPFHQTLTQTAQTHRNRTPAIEFIVMYGG
jgi:hypothetical protein